MCVCLTWGLNSGLMSNKSTHYLLDYDDSIFRKPCATALHYSALNKQLLRMLNSITISFLKFSTLHAIKNKEMKILVPFDNSNLFHCLPLKVVKCPYQLLNIFFYTRNNLLS